MSELSDYKTLLSENQIKQYLQRIYVKYTPPENRKLELSYLESLIRAHVRNIAFDNADVWAYEQVPDLRTEQLFNKMIINCRGGYCFELNSMFYRLLLSLGYDAYLVIVSLDGDPVNNDLSVPTHCSIIVKLNGKKYFCDVGVGGKCPDGALALGETRYGFGFDKVGVYTVLGPVKNENKIAAEFSFKDTACDMAEILPLNYYVSADPESMFRKNLLLNIKTDDGFIAINNNILKVSKNGLVTETVLQSNGEIQSCTEKLFKLKNMPVRDILI